MKEEAVYPDFFARFYDVLYEKLRGGADDHYYLRKIAETKGPVLEIGAGTGRFFIDALHQGADIYGIDISPEMIKVLKKKLEKKDHHRVSVQDATSFNFDKKFDLIIAPFRVLSHVMEPADQLSLLNQVNSYLTKDGQFIFDLYVPNLPMLINGVKNSLDFDGEYEKGKKLKRIVNMQADLMNQISYVNMKLVWDEDNRQVEKDWNFKMRYFFRFELEHLTKRSNLNLVQIFGDFSESKLNSESKEFIVVCKKSM
ncbi:MAG: class I SAM-dependent methyltransferase [Bacteroidales bacterium]|nr:class I SAM-dependent methyltransferase [Bacteroidales bacterium]